MQTRLSLLYVDCYGKKGGDFAAAAEIAYTLAKHHIFNPDDQSFLLASSHEGLTVFKKMYGTPTDSSLTIHDIAFHACALEDVLLPQGHYLEHYIEVANCYPAPLDLVSSLCHPSYTRITYIGLPHCSHMFHTAYRTTPQYNWIMDARYLPSIECITTGFGPKQIGIPLEDTPLPDINHTTYHDLTQHPFGLIYFDLHQPNTDRLISDYLCTAIRLKQPVRHFMVIGKCPTTIEHPGLDGLKIFARSIKKPIFCYDYGNKLTISIAYDQAASVVKIDKKAFKNIIMDDNAIHLALIPAVSNDEMRKLLRASIPFSGSTGIASHVEALAYGKISLHQVLIKNQYFLDSYVERVLSSPLTQTFSTPFIKTFLDLQNYTGRMTRQSHDALASYLNHDEFCRALCAFNQTLLRTSNEQVLPGLCQALRVPLPSPLLTHSLFTEPMKQKELPEHSPAAQDRAGSALCSEEHVQRVQ